jgi:hypothetical protein
VYKLLIALIVGIILFSITDADADAQNDSKSKSLIITEVELNAMEKDKEIMHKACKFELDLPKQDLPSQWIEIYNPTDQVLDVGGIGLGFPVNPNDVNYTTIVYPGSFAPMNPKEYRVVVSLYLPINASIVLAKFNGHITILDSTPLLNDTFADSRTWQRVDGEWIFKEPTPCAPIPEFSGMLFVILTASIFGITMLNHIKKR